MEASNVIDASQPVNAEIRYQEEHAHGIWHPGVVLMRRQRFAFKAALICAVFMVPISVLTVIQIRDKLEAMATTQKEIIGLDYMQPTFAVLEAAQGGTQMALANDAAGLAKSRQQLDSAFKRLEEVEAKLGTEMATGKAFSELTQKYKALDSAGEGLRHPRLREGRAIDFAEQRVRRDRIGRH